MPYTISYTEALREQTKRALDIPTDAPDAMKTWGVYVLAGAGNMNLPEDMRQNPSDTLTKLQEVYRTHSIAPMLSDDFEETENLWKTAIGGEEDAQGAWDELAKRSRETDGGSIWRELDEQGTWSEDTLNAAAPLLDESIRGRFLEQGRELLQMTQTAQDARNQTSWTGDRFFDLLAGGMGMENAEAGSAVFGTSGVTPSGEISKRSQEFEPLKQEAKKRLAARRYVEQVRRKNSFAMLAAIQPDLSDEAKSIIDRAIANGWEISDEDEAAFLPDSDRALPQEQMDLVAAFMAYCKPTDGSGALMQFVKRAGDTMGQVFTHSGQQLGDIVTGRVARREEYKNVLYQRAILEQLNSTNFADLGYFKNSFAEAGNIAGYWAPMILEAVATRGLGALSSAQWLARLGTAGRVISTGAGLAGKAAPWIGHYMFTADFQQQFLQRVVLDGGDPTAPETQLMMGIGAFAANLVEHIQWGNFTGKIGMAEIQAQAYSRLTHNILSKFGVKVGTQWGTMTVGKALGHVLLHSGMMVFTEAMEEALQQAIEETMVDLGSGRSVRIGNLMEQSVGAFTSTIGPMAWTAILGLPFRSKSAATMHNLDQGAIERLMSASERLKSLAAQGKLTDGREDITALNQLMFAVTRAPNARAAVNEMLRRGFSWDQSNTIVENFQAIQREAIERGQLGELGENVLPTQEELERTGWQVTPNDDGTLTATRDIETEDGKRRRQTLNISRIASQAVDVRQDEQAASTLNYLREQGPAARATYAALGIDLARANEEILADPNARNALALVAARENLRTAGDTRQTETRQTQDAQGNAIEEDVFDVTLAEQATRQTIFHEVAHAVAKTLRNMGLTEKEIDAIQNWRSGREGMAANERDMALPELPTESWNEERVGDEMGDAIAGADEPSKGRVAKAMNFIGDLVKRVLRIQKRQEAFRDAVAVMEEVVRSGHWGNIDELTDAQKRLLQAARQRRAEVAAQREAQPAEQGASAGEEGPSSTSEGPSQEEEGIKPSTDRTPLDRVVEAFCLNRPLLRDDMAKLAASGELTEAEIYETGYRWSPLLRCWIVRPECRDQPFTPNGPYMGLDGKWKGESARAMVASTRLVPGADLSDPETARELVNYFKTYPGAKPPKRLADASPAATYAWFRDNLVGKTFQIGDRSFTIKEGHYFRFVCETPEGDRVRKGWIERADSPEEARRLVEAGEVSAGEIAGFVHARAASLPFAPEIFTHPDAILTKGHKEYLLKKFDTGNANTDVAVFLLNRDGETLGLSSIHMREVGVGFLNGCTLAAFANEGASSPPGSLARDVLSPTDDARDNSAGTSQSQPSNAPGVKSENSENPNPPRASVSPRLPSPEFAMDGTIADALPAHLREDARAIIAERANTPAWMVEPDGTPTDLNERDWLRREAEARHYAGPRFAISGLYTGSAADYATRDEEGNIVNGPSLNHVGTGEGTQAFGWGLYASQRQNIAKWYAETDVTRKQNVDIKYDNWRMSWWPDEGLMADIVDIAEYSDAEFKFGEFVLGKIEDGDTSDLASRGLQEIARYYRLSKAQRERLYKLAPRLNDYIVQWMRENPCPGKSKIEPPIEHIYEQTFFTNRATPEETERHLLKWYDDVPDEQLDWIVKQWKKERLLSGYYTSRGLPKKGIPAWLSDDWRSINKHQGGHLYKTIALNLGSPKAASEFLARADIDGIKYPVDSSGGKTVKDGDKAGWNYVSFRDDNIRVDHKWVGREQRYQIAGRAGAQRLGVRGLGDAEAMERSGATREEIWRETGWWRGQDGKWRVEIGDIRLADDWKEKVKAGCQLRDIVSGPVLDAYDNAIGGVWVSVDESLKGSGTAGVFNIRLGTIRLNPDATKAKSGFLKTLAHEIQHTIQLEEGLERGTSLSYQMDVRERQVDMTAFPKAWWEYERRNKEFIPALSQFVQSIAEPWLRYVHDATIDENGRVSFHYETKEEIPRINGRMVRSLADIAKGVEKKLNKWKFYDIGGLARNGDLADVLRRVGADDLGWFLSDAMKESFGEEHAKWATDAQEAFATMASEAAAGIEEADAIVKEISRPLDEAFADARDAYNNAGGEVEARMVEARLGLTEEQRKEIPPWVTEAVVRQDTLARQSDYSYAAQRAMMERMESVRDAVAPRGAQKEAGVEYPDAGAEIGGARFAIGSGRRTEYGRLLQKHRPDLDAEAVLSELDKFGNPKKEKVALHWVIRGTVILPEDEYKVDDALAVAEKAKVDPFAYDSPMALLQAHKEFKPPAHGPIDPDTVPELSNKRDMGFGVTTYLVQDDEAGQKAMREILNTHYGRDFSPWCLLHGDGHGGLSSQAWQYWHDVYNALPKRVAFKDGKVIAFMATNGGVRRDRIEESFEYETGLEARQHPEQFKRWAKENGYRLTAREEWWDLDDSNHNGIPVTAKVEGDPIGRSQKGEVKAGKFKADNHDTYVRNGAGVREGWDKKGYVRREDTTDGGRITRWDRDGNFSHEDWIDVEESQGRQDTELVVKAIAKRGGGFVYSEGDREEIKKGHLDAVSGANIHGALDGWKVTSAEGSLDDIGIRAKLDLATGKWDIQHKGDIGKRKAREKFDAWREKFEAMMDRPADSIGPEEKEGGGKRYSIASLPSGARIALLDRNNEIAKIDLNDWRSLQSYLKQHVGQQLLDNLVIGDEAPTEYIFSKSAKGNNKRTRKAKAKLATGLDDAANVAEGATTEPAQDKPREGGVYYRRHFCFGVPSGYRGDYRVYEADMVSYKEDGEEKFYDVTNIEDAPALSAELTASMKKGSARITETALPASPQRTGTPRSQAYPGAESKSENRGKNRSAVQGRVRAFDDVPRYTPRGTMAALATLSYIAGEEPNAEHLEEVGRRLGNEHVEAREVMAEAKAIHDGILGKLSRKQDKLILQVAQEVAKDADMTPGEVAELVAGAIQALHPEDLVREAYMRGAGAQDWAQGTRGAALNTLVKQARGDNYADLVTELGMDVTGTVHRWILTHPEKPKAGGNGEAATGEEAQKAPEAPASDVGPNTREVHEAADALSAEQEMNIERALSETNAEMDERRQEMEEREARRAAEEALEDAGDDEDDGGDVDDADDSGMGAAIKIPVEMLERHLVDIRDPVTFALFLRKTVRNRILKANGMPVDFSNLDEARRAERALWSNPTNVAMFAKSMSAILRDMANRMLEHNTGAYTALIRKAALLQQYDDVGALEIEMQWAMRTLASASIRQTTAGIVNHTRAYLKKFIGPTTKNEHPELEEDLTRRITGRVREMAKWYRRVLSMSEGQIERVRDGWTDKDGKHHDGLRDILDQRGRALDDAGITGEANRENDAVFSKAAWRLAVLTQYGGTRYLLPGEARERCGEIETWMAKEALAWAQKIEAIEAKYEADRKTILEGCAVVDPATGEKRVHEEENWAERAWRFTVNTINQRLRFLFARASGDARKAADELVRRYSLELTRGTTRYIREKQEMRRDLVLAVRSVVGPRGVRKWLKRMQEEIPEEHAVVLSKQGYRQLTYGQVMHLYGYLRQTATYGDNIAKHGREGQRDYIERHVLTPEDLKILNLMMKIYGDRREALDAASCDLTGFPMKNPDPFYLPVKIKTPAQSGLETVVSTVQAMPDVFSERRKHGLDVDEKADIMAIFHDRMEKTARVLGFGRTGLDIIHTFGNAKVKEAITEARGAKFTKALIAHFTDWMNGGRPRLLTAGGDDAKLLNGLRTAFVYLALWGNALSAFKQTLSSPVFTLAREVGERGIFQDMAGMFSDGWKQAKAELTQSEPYKARYGDVGIMQETQEAVIGAGEGTLWQAILRAGMTPLQWGDQTPGILCQVTEYMVERDRLIEQGVEPEEAKRQAADKAMQDVEWTQQSSRTENLPEYSRRGDSGTRMLWMFASSPMLQAGWQVQRYVEWKEKKAAFGADSKEARDAKRALWNAVIVNHVVMPILFQVATAVFNLALGKEPPDEDDLLELVFAMLAGPFARLVFWGGIAKAVWNASWSTGIYGRHEVIPSMLTNAEQNAVDVFSNVPGDILTGDFNEVLEDLDRFLKRNIAPYRHARKAADAWVD